MKIIISLLIFGSFLSFAKTGSEKKTLHQLVTKGIFMEPQEESNKSWIHQFETLPLGEEMDHLEKMKNQRLNQFVSQ